LRVQSAISAAVTTITKTITVATPHMDGYVARGASIIEDHHTVPSGLRRDDEPRLSSC